MLSLLLNKTCRQHQNFRFSPFLILFTFAIFSSLFFACRSAQKTDMRAFAPKETIAYVEFKDLSQTLKALTDNRVFQENSTGKTDFSALENIQAAVVVTGFDASEKQISDENAILNFKPKFVAIADTHAWNATAISIAENQIGKFARRVYGDDVKLETFEKSDARFFIWTSRDRRKLFSAVSESIVYAGNDEALLEKCLAVKHGEAESLQKNESFVQEYNRKIVENPLVFGYLSPAGIKQFAGIAGVSAAVETTDGDEERALISRILPKILQNTTEEIVWTARKNGDKIEDDFFVSLSNDAASVFKETFASSSPKAANQTDFLPADIFGATVYNLENPLTAWRSLLLVTAKNADAMSGKYLIEYSDQLLAPYGISNAEMFLSAVDAEIFTVQFDAEGEKSAVIVGVKDTAKIKKSIAEINFKSAPEKRENIEIWKSESGEIVAAFIENKLIFGDGESVLKCLQARQNGDNLTKNQNLQKLAQSRSTAVTFSKDSDSAEKIIAILGNAKVKNQKITTEYITETDFTDEGVERKYISDFGFLGTILEHIYE